MAGICDTTCSISTSSTCPTASESGCYQANDTQTSAVCAQLACDSVWVKSPGSCDQYCDFCTLSKEPTCYVCENFLPTDCEYPDSEIGAYCFTDCSIDYCVATSTSTATNSSTSSSVTTGSATTTSITTTSRSTTSGTSLSSTITSMSITTTSSSTASGTSTSSITATSTLTPCVDVVPDQLGYTGVLGWEDSNGFACEWYFDNACFPGTSLAASFANYGMTASEACCACGGGMNGYSSTTETGTTTSHCEDWRPASEDYWYVDSTSQDCSYLAYFCQKDIASVVSFGHTATEACCYCGGGTGFTSTRTSVTDSSSSTISATTSTTDVTYTFTLSSSTTITSTTSTSSPTTHSSSTSTTASSVTRCEDWVPLMMGLTENSWYDSGGPAYTCEFYEDNGLCGTGQGLANFGRTADEACCACGGGVNAESTSTTTATTTTLCVDMVPDGSGAYWSDSRGDFYSCSYYAHGDFCTSQAPLYPNHGYTAQEVCCACSGGTGKTVTNTTLTESSTASTHTTTITSTITTSSTTSTSTISTTSTTATGSNTSSTTATTFSRTSSSSTTASSTFSLSSSTSATTASDTSSWSETTTSTVTLSSSTSATVSTLSSTRTTETSCADYVPESEDKWYDPLGALYDCAWYALDGGEHCGAFASVQDPTFGRTANEACCVCGGGVHYSVTTTSTLSTTTECFDWQPSPQEDWYDGDGSTCRYYERELLVRATCSESKNFGMIADQACCVCGGGVGRTVTETSPTQTSSTTLSATASSTTRTQTVPPAGYIATTVLVSPVLAGASELAVESEEAHSVGDIIMIAGGGNAETRGIASFGSIVLDAPLDHGYPAGSSLYRYTEPGDAVEDASASGLAFALVLGLVAVGVVVAWAGGLLLLKFGYGYHFRAPKTHPKATGHDPPRAPRGRAGHDPPRAPRGRAGHDPPRAPRGRAGREDLIFDMDDPPAV